MRLSVLTAGISVFALLSGCVSSAPYVMTTDRVDQAMSAGNKGYVKGTPPPAKDRGDLKRPLIAIDVDLPAASGRETRLINTARRAPVAKEVPAMEEEIK